MPASSGARSFACPRCKSVFAMTVDKQVIIARPLTSGVSQTCPICQTAIADGEKGIACPSCSQIHHQECWIEVGGCSTYGCPQAPPETKESATQPLTAWGDTKECPVCGETIKAIALKCRYCQTEFDSVDPLTMRDLHRKESKSQTQQKLRTTVCVLFGISLLLGCAAPLMLFIQLAVYLPQRKQLAGLGPIYVVLAYSGIALTTLYSVMMLFFFVFGDLMSSR
jgi:hypothetical protein